MKLFDFVNKLRADNKPSEKPKKDLGVCVPVHALSEGERKKKLADNDTIVDTLKKKPKEKDNDIEFIDKTVTKETYSNKDSLGLGMVGREAPKTPIKKEKAEPVPAKEKDAEEIEEEVIQKVEVKGRTPRNTFRVTGLYDFGTTTMISGVVEAGQVSVKMRADLENKKEIVISEIKISSTKVNGLIAGEEGSLFVRTKGNPVIRYDDLIEFK
jgi:hypothetical protein